VRRARAVACVAVALGALVTWTWGCATSEPPPSPNPRAARDYEPDGGWASYRPSWGSQQTPTNDPGGPLSGPVVPVIPGSSTVPSTVH